MTIKEENKRIKEIETEKKEQGRIKQQISRAIEEDRRDKDEDIEQIVAKMLKKRPASELSTAELEEELKKRSVVNIS